MYFGELIAGYGSLSYVQYQRRMAAPKLLPEQGNQQQQRHKRGDIHRLSQRCILRSLDYSSLTTFNRLLNSQHLSCMHI